MHVPIILDTVLFYDLFLAFARFFLAFSSSLAIGAVVLTVFLGLIGLAGIVWEGLRLIGRKVSR